MARPRTVIDEQALLDMAAKNFSFEEMGAHLDVDAATLRRRFARVIEKGRLKMTGSLKSKQFELAMNGDRTMLIWLGKQYLGQSDKREEVHRDGSVVDLIRAEAAKDQQAGG